MKKDVRPGGMGFEQHGLVVDVPVHDRGVGKNNLEGPFQHKPFYNSMITSAVNTSDS